MNIVSLLITGNEVHDNSLTISGEKFHHLVHVRRLVIGDELRAALPDGRVLNAQITAIAADSILAIVTAEESPRGISPCSINLYQAILKGEKMEMIVQKACELGATTFTPLHTQRIIPQWNKAQQNARVIRWQRIADAASEQSERSITMHVLQPIILAEALTNYNLNLILHERDGVSITEMLNNFPTLPEIGLFIGPEGGWSENESALALAAGARMIHLGDRILRAETAAIVALTLAQYLWGDLGK